MKWLFTAHTALFATLATAYPGSHRYATVLDSRQDAQDVYDYIVVGAGTAGLTVGDRLSESGKYSVLAIEYGYLEDKDPQSGPANPAYIYNITSVPSPHLANRTVDVKVGCTVGGSSAINGQFFQRGTAADYDAWAELSGTSNSTWGWSGIFPYFRKGIQLIPPSAELAAAYNITYDPDNYGHNASRPNIFATFATGHKPEVATMYNAVKQLPGVDLPLDGSGGQNGLYWFPLSAEPGTARRSYSRTGHWEGLNRPNYQLLPATKVIKVVIQGGRAIGVEVTPRDGPDAGKKKTILRAKKEVILAAGAIHTPKVLQLSGVGPESLLKNLDIPVKVDLPGVGANLQDHYHIPGVSFQWTTQPTHPAINISTPDISRALSLGLFLPLTASTPRAATLASRYAAQNPLSHLPPTTHPTVLLGYTKQQDLISRQMLSKNFTFFMAAFTGQPSWLVQNLRPLARGTVTLDPIDPVNRDPVVDFRGGSNPIDIEVLVENVKFFRRFMGSEGPMKAYGAVPVNPGVNVQSDDELDRFVRGNAVASVYHQCCTAAKMPREWGGVVDEELRVYGVKGLSVADASVWPVVVGSTTSMSVYATAEKAADLIKARQ